MAAISEKLQPHIATVYRAYPEAQEHIEAFVAIGSQVTWAKLLPAPNRHNYGIVIIRFSPVLESSFNFQNEVAVVFLPFRDLQSRAYSGLRALLHSIEADRSIDKSLCFVAANDPKLREKTLSWNSLTFTAIPLESPTHRDSGGETDRLSRAITTFLTRRDFYTHSSSVSGEMFFGRRHSLMELSSRVMGAESFGVFGLRKMGKTSLVEELFAILQSGDSNSVLTIKIDLQGLPAEPKDAARALSEEIRQKIRTRLDEGGRRTVELADLESHPNPADLKTALSRLLQKIRDESLRLVLVLDEIEHLVPPRNHPDLDPVAELMGALRGVQQETGRFVLAFCGVTPYISLLPQFGRRANPFMAWITPHFLGPFTLDESKDLIVGLGRRMAVQWDDDAMALAAKTSGGHAFLLRQLCGRVVRELPGLLGERRVALHQVSEAVERWPLEEGAHARAILQDFRQNYPDEGAAIDLLGETGVDSVSVDDIGLDSARSLLGLGLLSLQGPQVEATDLYRALSSNDSR